jgi:hypothetical protein
MLVLRVGREARREGALPTDDPGRISQATLDLQLGPDEIGLSVFRVEGEDETIEVAVQFALTCRDRPAHVDFVVFPEELATDLGLTGQLLPRLHRRAVGSGNLGHRDEGSRRPRRPPQVGPAQGMVLGRFAFGPDKIVPGIVRPTREVGHTPPWRFPRTPRRVRRTAMPDSQFTERWWGSSEARRLPTFFLRLVGIVC